MENLTRNNYNGHDLKLFNTTSSSSSLPTPTTMISIRVDATMLSQNVSKTIRIIGQLKSINENDNSGILDSNGTVNFQIDNNFNELLINNYYEFIAIVKPDLSIKVLQTFNFGDNLNINAVNKMVEVVHKIPELYYE